MFSVQDGRPPWPHVAASSGTSRELSELSGNEPRVRLLTPRRHGHMCHAPPRCGKENAMKNSNDSKARNTNRATKKRDEAIEAIARNILEIETLAERKSDSLDFHEVSVWGLRDALLAAYELGLAAAKKGA